MATPNGTTQAVAERRNTPALHTREEFGARETTALVETAASAVAAQARARVEAAYVMAMRQPRDIEEVRQGLLRDCRRPAFAEEAFYRKPTGDEVIEDFSIRFAEAAVRHLRNIEVDTPTTYDDHARRIVKVIVVDLEANTPYSKDITIQKTVERRNNRGRVVLGERTNSRGNVIYLVEATEDEVATKEAALISKAMRTLVLRILPADIKEECRQAVRDTMKKRDAEDPDAARKKLADAFAALNVSPTDLRTYLGHGLDKCSPAQLAELRGIYTSLKDGEATWADVLATKQAASDQAGAATNAKAENLRTGTGGNAGTPPDATSSETPAADTGGASGDDVETVDGPELNCACPDGLGGQHFRDCAELAKALAKAAAPSGTPSGRGLFGKRGE